MKPKLPGYQITELVGTGVCGEVWAAEDPVGNEVAVRTLNALSVNLDLVREVGRRLHGVNVEGHGPVPLWLQALELKPAMEVTPLIADRIGDEIVPRSLQALLGDYLATSEAETVVKCLAKALSALHRHQVVHGNLKPSNIFVSEEGRILVGDYGLGWMPGIDVLGFSDALLYMAPEQLQEPAGFYHEAGYRWDVFSFGVLAYRLLEGHFPRCDESFADVAPAAGAVNKEGIEADFGGVAEELCREEMRPWQGSHDNALKRIVERCLHIDPAERFRDMVELCEVWERETLAVRHAVEMEIVAGKLRSGRRWRKGLSWGMAASLFIGAGAGTGWLVREQMLEEKLAKAQKEQELAEKEEASALANRDEAFLKRDELKRELGETQLDVENLSEGRRMLLDWAFSEGGDELPVLVGRVGRLELLDQQYGKLIRTEGVTDSKWKRRWQAERSLLALIRDQPDEARNFINNEVSRLGGSGLTRLLLKESSAKKTSPEELALARTLVNRTGSEQKAWLQSALDLVEIRGVERTGQKDRALRLLSELAGRLSKLPASEPGTVSLWRTRLHREAAEVAEGSGREELAVEFRTETIETLRNELGAEGLSESLRRELSEQFVVASEGLAEQLYARGELEAAQALSKEARERVLDSIIPRVRVALAVHAAVLGGCHREMGKTEDARALVADGLKLLESPFDDAGVERWRRYRQGMLQWQLAGVFGQLEDSGKEFTLGEEALTTMRTLLEEGGPRPSAIQIHRVIGYLSSDLASAVEKAGRKDERLDLLDEAIESWKFLLAANPKEPEYVAGLAWCEGLKDR